MISKDYAEKYFPDFVEEVARELAIADRYARKVVLRKENKVSRRRRKDKRCVECGARFIDPNKDCEVCRQREYVRKSRKKPQSERRTYNGRCATCGVSWKEKTFGCITCYNRHYSNKNKKMGANTSEERAGVGPLLAPCEAKLY